MPGGDYRKLFNKRFQQSDIVTDIWPVGFRRDALKSAAGIKKISCYFFYLKKVTEHLLNMSFQR
jgi:hypothetical protein